MNRAIPILLWLSAGVLPAQRFAEMPVRTHLPPTGAQGAEDVVLADLDGDGNLDALFAGRPGLLWLGDGRGGFVDVTETHLPAAHSGSAIAVGDLDGDGALDVVLVDYSSTHVWQNDGAAHFTDVTATHAPPAPFAARCAVLGDVDGDLDVDVVIGRIGADTLWLNDGTGRLVEAPAGRLPADPVSTWSVLLRDVDADGDADLIAGGNGNELLYRNDGTGTFVADPSAIPPDSETTSVILLGDVDGDGDLDLFCADWTLSPSGAPNRLLLNEGTGHFTDVSATNLPASTWSTEDAAFGDIDGDGALDVLLATSRGDTNRVLSGDGSGHFVLRNGVLRDATTSSTSVALGDVDGNGAPDAMLGNQLLAPTLLLNDGHGTSWSASEHAFPSLRAEPTLVVAGDVDGDGDLDLFDGVYDGENALWLGDGEGRFVEGDFPRDRNDVGDAAFVDVDGDGDLDLFVATGPDFDHFDGQDLLYLNDGLGNFSNVTATHLPADSELDVQVEVGDVDADGDPDIVVGAIDAWLVYGRSGQPRLYRNDGTGHFTDDTLASLPVHAENSASIVLADIDGDRDLDLLIAGYTRLRVWLNDGTGHFTDETLARAPWAATRPLDAIEMLDADGDGDLDLACAVSLPIGVRAELHRNDGDGHFASAEAGAMPDLAADGTLSLAVGDVDCDGDPDLLLVGEIADLLFACEQGVFVDATGDLPPSAKSRRASFADLDRDGDLDLLSKSHVFTNRTRQLRAPRLPGLGGALWLEAFAEPGTGTWPTVVLPMLAAGLAPAPLPVPGLGSVRIDPNTSVPLPFVATPPGFGTAAVAVPVPVDRSLIGVRVFAQALFLPLEPGRPMHVSATVDAVFLGTTNP